MPMSTSNVSIVTNNKEICKPVLILTPILLALYMCMYHSKSCIACGGHVANTHTPLVTPLCVLVVTTSVRLAPNN